MDFLKVVRYRLLLCLLFSAAFLTVVSSLIIAQFNRSPDIPLVFMVCLVAVLAVALVAEFNPSRYGLFWISLSSVVLLAGIAAGSVYFVYEPEDFTLTDQQACGSARTFRDGIHSAAAAEAAGLQRQYSQAEVICEATTVDQWYQQNARINQLLYSYGTFAVIVLSFLTALSVGADMAKRSDGWRIVTIALPLASTAIAAVTSQFHFQDSWQLREIGRIDAEALLTQAERLSPSAPTFDTDIGKIRTDLLMLKKDQASRYFSYRFAGDSDPSRAGGAGRPFQNTSPGPLAQ